MSVDEGGMSFRATAILTKDPYPARCVAVAPLTGDDYIIISINLNP